MTERSNTHFLTGILLALGLVLALPETWAHGAYHDELAVLGAEMEKAPGDSELILKRAKLHLSHDAWVEALADLERFDRLKPAFPRETDGLRGLACNQGKLWDAALEALDAHLQAFPEDMDAVYERGRSRFQLRDPGSTDDFRKALASVEVTSPDKVLAAVDAIEIFEGVPNAAEFLGRMIQSLGTEPSLAERAIDLYSRLGEFDNALRHLDAVTALAPRPEPGMARRARILEQAGRNGEARDAWIALKERISKLPNLERGSPLLSQIFADAQAALGEPAAAPVVAPPAPATKPVP